MLISLLEREVMKMAVMRLMQGQTEAAGSHFLEGKFLLVLLFLLLYQLPWYPFNQRNIKKV